MARGPDDISSPASTGNAAPVPIGGHPAAPSNGRDASPDSIDYFTAPEAPSNGRDSSPENTVYFTPTEEPSDGSHSNPASTDDAAPPEEAPNGSDPNPASTDDAAPEPTGGHYAELWDGSVSCPGSPSDAALLGPIGGHLSAPSSGSNSTARDIKTVGFIGFNEQARLMLRPFETVANRPVNNERRWSRTVYLAREQSAAPSQESTRGDTGPAATAPPEMLDIQYADKHEVAMKSDLIILNHPPEMVLTTLREEGIADALSGKVVVSVTRGVTVVDIYDALYPGNRPPSPDDDPQKCYMICASLLPDYTGKYGRWVYDFPFNNEVTIASESQANLVMEFFSSVGRIWVGLETSIWS